MHKITSLAVVLALVASSSFAGGPNVVQPESVVSPVAMDESGTPMGSLGLLLPLLIGGVVIALLVTGADDSTSGTRVPQG